MITTLQQLVLDGNIKNIYELYTSPYPLLDHTIIDKLNVQYKVHIVNVRRVFKTVESGRKSKISLHVMIVGTDFIGFGTGSAMVFMGAKENAIINAKKNIVPTRLNNPINANTIYCCVKYKMSSTIVTLQPVNKGTGLVCSTKVKEILSNITNLEVRLKRSGGSNALNFYGAIYGAFKQLWSIR